MTLPRRLWLLGLLGLLPLLDPRLAPLRVFLLFFLAPVVADLLSWRRRRAARNPAPPPPSEAPPRPELPLPGPAERGGPLRFLLRCHLSSTLALLNPFQLAQVVRQARGQEEALRRVASDPPDAASYRQQVEYSLPFGGEWLVMNGGVTPETSHSWDLVAQRYAYDFVAADAAGRRHAGDGRRKEEYFAYGRPVLAPADGEVVEVRDGVRDAPGVGTGWVDWLCRSFPGNTVTLRHAEGEFSFLAHLVPGSIRVRPGERVRRGEEVGRCGNSGHSTEPHLHFQVQDHPEFFRAVGLPVAFSGCAVDGAPAGEPVHLRAGMRVRPEEEG